MLLYVLFTVGGVKCSVDSVFFNNFVLNGTHFYFCKHLLF